MIQIKLYCAAVLIAVVSSQPGKLIMLKTGRDPITNDELCIAADDCEKGSCSMLGPGSKLKLSRCHRISEAQLWLTDSKRLRPAYVPDLCVQYSSTSKWPKLKDCSGSSKQKFQMNGKGNVAPKKEANLCFTHTSSEPSSGDMIMLESCKGSMSNAQEWEFVDPADCKCLDGLAKNCSVPAYDVVDTPAKSCSDLSSSTNPHAYWNNGNFKLRTNKRPCSTNAGGYGLVNSKSDADIQMDLGGDDGKLYFSKDVKSDWGRDWGVGEVWPFFTDDTGNLIDPYEDDRIPCVRFYTEGEWKTMTDTDHLFPDRTDYKFGSLECCKPQYSDRRFFLMMDGVLVDACGIKEKKIRSC
mmetsp:Transcript_13348/g.28977  ORF Transcript_13348/g.28977 Transcript_13348/m.28977 type:complete len:353 (+) Transcript_13348:188-1246(+)